MKQPANSSSESKLKARKAVEARLGPLYKTPLGQWWELAQVNKKLREMEKGLMSRETYAKEAGIGGLL